MERGTHTTFNGLLTPDEIKLLSKQALNNGHKVTITPTAGNRYTLEVLEVEPIFAYLARVEHKLSDLACCLEDAVDAKKVALGYKSHPHHVVSANKALDRVQREIQTLKDVIDAEIKKLSDCSN